MRMKTSSESGPRPRPLDRAKALNCLILNQLATPGLGSWLGGRRIAACGQLLLAGTGFSLIVLWFMRLMIDLVHQLNGRAVAGGWHRKLGAGGGGLFLLAWLWALCTSLSLLRQARRNEAASLTSASEGP